MLTIADRDGAASVAPSATQAAEVAGSSIDFEDVTVSYGGTVVLDRFSLSVAPGEILALIGPSGSGKTTALRAVAGFVRPASGRIRIGEQDITDIPPYARGLGMVVQNYALFPHMRVDQNVAFGLRAQNADPALIATRVGECLELVGMSSFARRYPAQLSGGQQQRVAIARALAIRPRVLLLDEPLSALDAQIRRNMVEELGRLHRDLPNLTVLYVTHDQSEALTLADRIAILRDGRLNAFGPSRSLYQAPTSRFAAEFLGRANLLPVTVSQLDADGVLARVRLGEHSLSVRCELQLAPGHGCLLCIRPHALRLADLPTGNGFRATVETALWQGDTQNVTLRVEGVALNLTVSPSQAMPERGSAVWVDFAPHEATLIADEPAHG
ncbi:MAG: ATP-binding cassette domain-containing protein [Rhodobacteraceae bacterium]|nr:ATP-binding cassette domain-containing protein [Paracoccaceae bacterium]